MGKHEATGRCPDCRNHTSEAYEHGKDVAKTNRPVCGTCSNTGHVHTGDPEQNRQHGK